MVAFFHLETRATYLCVEEYSPQHPTISGDWWRSTNKRWVVQITRMRILTWVRSIPRLGLSAPVAQLDRALVSGTRGRRFESSRAYLGAAAKRPFLFALRVSRLSSRFLLLFPIPSFGEHWEQIFPKPLLQWPSPHHVHPQSTYVCTCLQSSRYQHGLRAVEPT